MENNPEYFIGIDEAGRGPLAGPLVVGGVRIAASTDQSAMFAGIRDSKKLTAKQREEWYERITSHPDIRWTAAVITRTTIDKINIYQAAQLGTRRVHKILAQDEDCFAMLDGSLFLPPRHASETIIKGDEKIPLISAASVIAKVTRDRIMLRLHKKYPHYRFDLHKGYATALHRDLITKFGRSPVHRISFRAD